MFIKLCLFKLTIQFVCKKVPCVEVNYITSMYAAYFLMPLSHRVATAGRQSMTVQIATDRL